MVVNTGRNNRNESTKAHSRSHKPQAAPSGQWQRGASFSASDHSAPGVSLAGALIRRAIDPAGGARSRTRVPDYTRRNFKHVRVDYLFRGIDSAVTLSCVCRRVLQGILACNKCLWQLRATDYNLQRLVKYYIYLQLYLNINI